ncbi:MAG: exodeoxyribonuclease VII large subunit [Acidobacteria bacterium]|nr:exodeoxyribonuclease VII large subunit [Acidobacteriota bacterium]
MSDSVSQFSLNFLPERRIYRVSELSRLIREKLEAEFADLWVVGEISNFREAPSGHLYFTLKDEAAQLRCVCFRLQARYLRFRPEDGLQVTARGRISVYEARGEYQLNVEALEPQGLGALQLAFEQLKKKLSAEGLFDAARKKPLPKLPRRIGIITSPRGAVIQDMIRILRRRHENLHLLVYPVRVQGEGAAEEMVEALGCFNRPPPNGVPVDVIILARGGGSLEDLWAFNEEKLAWAIAASTTPVISAVGHETDFTIADFVADLRAPTPSAAAEMVIETQERLQEHILILESDLVRVARYHLLRLRHQLSELITHRAFQTLRTVLGQAIQRHDELSTRAVETLRERLRTARRRWEQHDAFLLHFDLHGRQERKALLLSQHRTALAQRVRVLLIQKRARAESLAAQLQQLSPRRILERGYAIAFDASGKLLTEATQVSPGEEIALRLAQGRLTAVVRKIVPE